MTTEGNTMNWVVDANSSNTVEDFIIALAGVCDGAHQQDRVGFNGGDADFGHAMAARATNGQPYSVKMANACLKLVRRYQRQLGGKDFIDEWMKQPVFKRQPYDPNAPRVVVNTSVQTQENDRKLSSDEKTAIFKFNYNTEILYLVKNIRGEYKGIKYRAIWRPDSKTWQVPVNESSILKIMDVAEKYGFEIEQRFKDYHVKVEAKMNESKVMLALTDGQNISIADDSILIAVDDPAILEEFKQALRINI